MEIEVSCLAKRLIKERLFFQTRQDFLYNIIINNKNVDQYIKRKSDL